MKQINRAFSLIELSIVILIIGILVAGVTQSSRLVKKMRLQTAQNLTMSSPMPSIKDIVFWYETSLDKSFNDSEAQDNTDITVWYDLNPQTSSKYDATPPAVANRPKYIENVFNGGSLPAVRFNGADDYLRVTSVGLSGTQLTYFVVAKRNAVSPESSPIVGIKSGVVHDFDNVESFVGFYEWNGSQLQAYRAGGKSNITNHPGNNIPYIASSVFNGTNNFSYLNGVSYTSVASSGNFIIDNFYLACRWVNSGATSFYNADFAEIIVFSRALKDEERKSIEQYLGKKWGIKVS